jgi:L-ectoine synthase
MFLRCVRTFELGVVLKNEARRGERISADKPTSARLGADIARSGEEREMLVRDIDSAVGTPRHVRGEGWDSKRLVVAADRVGFSLHDTTIREGIHMELQYQHHVEANYCFAGEGEVVDMASGERFQLRPGSVYVLDKHDRHVVRAIKGDLRFVCVFTPALAGEETHTPDGGYEPIPTAPDSTATD